MKHLSLFLILPFLIPLSSCSQTKEKIPVFSYESSVTEYETKKRYLTYSVSKSQLQSLIQCKGDFFLYVYAPGCGTCDYFSVLVNDYINTNKVVFPYMFLSLYNQVEGVPSLSDSSLLFFRDGKCTDTVLVSAMEKDNDLFYSKMDENCVLEGVSLLNSCYVDTFLQNGHVSYFLSSELSLDKNDNAYVSNPYDSKTLFDKQAVVLLIDEKSYPDLSKLPDFLTAEKITDIAFVSAEKDKGTLFSLLGIDETFDPIIKLTYADNVINTITYQSI